MEPITLASTFATIVGLLGVWKSEVDGRKSQDLDKFIDWLRRHEHEQVVNLIHDNAELSRSLKTIVETQHDEVMAALAKLDNVLSSVASHIAEFQFLAVAIRAKSRLSDQAVSILRQMNEAGSSTLMELKHLGGTDYQTCDGASRAITIQEPRFMEDDLSVLCELGLLRLDYGNQGTPFFVITRAGAEIGK